MSVPQSWLWPKRQGEHLEALTVTAEHTIASPALKHVVSFCCVVSAPSSRCKQVTCLSRTAIRQGSDPPTSTMEVGGHGGVIFWTMISHSLPVGTIFSLLSHEYSSSLTLLYLRHEGLVPMKFVLKTYPLGALKVFDASFENSSQNRICNMGTFPLCLCVLTLFSWDRVRAQTARTSKWIWYEWMKAPKEALPAWTWLFLRLK